MWDKEHPTVWEGYLASLDPEKADGHQPSQLHHSGGGLPPAHPGAIPTTTMMMMRMRRDSSADSLVLGGGRAGKGAAGNALLPSLPQDVFMELFGLLGPGDCVRCLR